MGRNTTYLATITLKILLTDTKYFDYRYFLKVTYMFCPIEGTCQPSQREHNTKGGLAILIGSWALPAVKNDLIDTDCIVYLWFKVSISVQLPAIATG